MIDDVRCFLKQNKKYANYPNLEYLIKWCEINNFIWHIEHDIFAAKNYNAS